MIQWYIHIILFLPSEAWNRQEIRFSKAKVWHLHEKRKNELSAAFGFLKPIWSFSVERRSKGREGCDSCFYFLFFTSKNQNAVKIHFRRFTAQRPCLWFWTGERHGIGDSVELKVCFEICAVKALNLDQFKAFSQKMSSPHQGPQNASERSASTTGEDGKATSLTGKVCLFYKIW